MSKLFLSYQSLHLTPSQCSAIFSSDADRQEHLKTCLNSSSTDSSSNSLDVETLSDSSLEWDANPVINHGNYSPSNGDGTCKTGQVQTKSRHNSTSSGSRSPLDHQHHYLRGFDTLNVNDLVLCDHDSEDDEEEIVNYSKGEMARLLSLNEHDMMDDDEDCSGEDKNGGKVQHGEGKLSASPDSKSTKAAKKKQGVKSSGDGKRSTHRVAMEPVGVFWDIENCSVPIDKSAFAVAAKMRREFITGKREAEFMCVCDVTKERKEVTDDLHKAQVSERGGCVI